MTMSVITAVSLMIVRMMTTVMAIGIRFLERLLG